MTFDLRSFILKLYILASIKPFCAYAAERIGNLWNGRGLGHTEAVLTVSQALENLAVGTQSKLLDDLGAKFADAGFEIALVGGSVRDAFLGKLATDFDLTTDARPDDTAKLLRSMTKAVWEIGREFGTIGAELKGIQVEITTYRADSYQSVSRKPEVQFGSSLEGDLRRRDFTVNAMALRLPQRVFVDPHEGLAHLIAGRLQTPGPAEESFSDDPLRMLRAARFTSQLNLTPSEDTVSAMRKLAGRLEIISAERIRDELVKLISSQSPRVGLEMLVETGLADHFLPELPALRLETDEHHHHKDVYQHSLQVLEQAIDFGRDYGLESDSVLRLAALLHDIGKPATRKLEPGGAVSFYHHDVVGAKLAKRRLTALRFDKDTIEQVSRLIELHLRFFGYSDQPWSDSAVRRYVRDAGEQLNRLHVLTRADVTTRNKRKAERLAHAYDDLEDRINQLAVEEELAAMRPALNGNEIMEILGLGPSPLVGEAYQFLMELRLDEGELSASEAKDRLLSWWASR
jgi:poly(A) polymerase